MSHEVAPPNVIAVSIIVPVYNVEACVADWVGLRGLILGKNILTTLHQHIKLRGHAGGKYHLGLRAIGHYIKIQFAIRDIGRTPAHREI